MAAMIASGMICQSIPYSEGFGTKQIAWLVHSAVVGSVVAPLTLLGGPLMIRAACYTAGVVGGNIVHYLIIFLYIFGLENWSPMATIGNLLRLFHFITNCCQTSRTDR